MRRLLHYSEEPVDFDRDRVYEQDLLSVSGKPDGLWVSVPGERDWPTYCREGGVYLHDLTHIHEVQLRPYPNILRLSSPLDVDLFHTVYSVPTALSFGRGRDSWGVDWPRVASEYAGLVIAPYIYSRRLRYLWYYGWDCASGCIWNLEAIESFELTTHETSQT